MFYFVIIVFIFIFASENKKYKIMEKDFIIYNELRAAAERVFNEGIQAPAGVYTLAELAKVGTTCKTAIAGVYFGKEYNADQLININIDGFECSYPARQAFALAYKFERLAKVETKARAVFQRVEDHGEPVAVFTVDAVLCNSLAACENPRKGDHFQMQGVLIDVAAGLACCCDCYALNVSRLVDVKVFDADALNGSGVCLSRDFIKSVKGCEVSLFKDSATLCAVASNGASCKEIPERYPNYKSVFSHVDESAPVRLVKSICELKKTAAAVAKAAGCEYIFISGFKGDDFITISAQSYSGEVTRRVVLAECLTATFATACSAVRLKTINNAADTFYVAQNGSIVFSGSKCVAMIAPCSKTGIDTAIATAADNEKTRLNCNYNAFTAFAAPNAEHVAPAVSSDSIQAAESNDNAGTVKIRRLMFDFLRVAAVIFFVLFVRVVSTNTSNAEHVAPVVSSDSIQAAESNDNADTLDAAPVAPAKNPYIIGSAKN